MNTRIVKLSDWHVPYEDKAALVCAINFTFYLWPDIIIIDEPIDFYALSKYNKNPRRALDLQKEIDATCQYFEMIRTKFTDTRIIVLNSNHTERLQKYLRGKAPELSELRSLSVQNLLNFDKYNFEFMDVYVHYNKFVFKHGDFINKHSGATARSEFEYEGMSGVSGHSHRLSQYYVTKRGGSYIWTEGGCLCKLDPEYISGVPNWQHGLTKIDFVGDMYLSEIYPIFDGKVINDRKILRALGT